MTQALEVAFRGATLLVVEHNQQPYVPMKPVVSGMGMDWAAQFAKLKANTSRWGITEIVIPTSRGTQGMVCLPLRKLPGWLATISPNKVKPELREKIIAYQNEADDVLWAAWQKQDARPYAVLPGQTLSAEQADELRRLLTEAAQKLPHAQQGAFLQRGWSKLKAHFGVPYREIPASQYSEAVSLIARHALESAPALPALPEARVLIPVADDFNLDEAKHHLIKAWSVSMLIGQEILACLHKRPEAKAFLVEIPAGNKNTPTVRALMPAQGDFS
ncbi:hypothetical protein CO610_07275 [Lysobacteraceae bacterium NML95-0200]|nr:hypothetical protein CO610_07275 [Xanthomonadaceae bacterium NML95-0200]